MSGGEWWLLVATRTHNVHEVKVLFKVAILVHVFYPVRRLHLQMAPQNTFELQHILLSAMKILKQD